MSRKAQGTGHVPDGRELVTIEEMAAYARVNKDKVYGWIRRGLLKTQKVVVENGEHLRRKTLIVRQSVKDVFKIVNRSDDE